MRRFSSFTIDYDHKFKIEWNNIIKTSQIKESIVVLTYEFYDEEDTFIFLFNKNGEKKTIHSNIGYFEITVNRINEISICLSCSGKTYTICFMSY